MRDLTARLREIVRSDATRRPLTYEPEIAGVDSDGQIGLRAAELLNGTLCGPSCIAIDQFWDVDRSHGRDRVGTFVIDAASPMALFDPIIAACHDWSSHVVYFDIESTGLSGGAGTLAFLAGCGWFDESGFRVRQFLVGGPAGEHVLLAALTEMFREASLLVTYNGRTFDVPLMETRWAFHRQTSPTDDVRHLDMLPPARRLWGRRRARMAPVDDGTDTSCSLSALERSVLGFHRFRDVPGIEIPSRYFQFLRTGNPERIRGVLEHNAHDVLSLAALTARALRLAAEGPESCREPHEQFGLGRVYERARDAVRARQSYELAAGAGERDVRRQALARLALLLRRESRYAEAAAAWQGVLDLSDDRPPTPLDRLAVEALAIHHEHRARDPVTARRYAQVLRAHAAGQSADEVDHRLGRLDRKIRAAEKTKSGPKAARFFD